MIQGTISGPRLDRQNKSGYVASPFCLTAYGVDFVSGQPARQAFLPEDPKRDQPAHEFSGPLSTAMAGRQNGSVQMNAILFVSWVCYMLA